MPSRYRNFLLAILGAHLAALILFAAFRLVGGDEGFYLNATRMVGLGKEIYAEFFYTQMMLMPTVFSALALHGWTSFWILRGLAVAAGFLSAILFFAIVLRITKDFKSALIVLAMYAFSGLIISMHTLYEPPVFAHLLTLATFFFWLRYRESGTTTNLIFLGLFLSALINHRAIFVVLLPLYIWSLLSLSGKGRIKTAAIFLLAMIPMTFPTLVKVIQTPSNFIYDTFAFQTVREADRSLSYILNNRALTLFRTIIDPHLLIIIVLTIAAIVLLSRSGKLKLSSELPASAEGMALLNLLLIAGAYFVPHPILRHYAEQFLAFALILIACAMPSMMHWLEISVRESRRHLLVGALGVFYILSLVPYVALNIVGIRDADHRYALTEMKRVTSKMLELGKESDTVLAEWAGYPFFTGQTSLPFTEIIGFHWPLPLDHDGYMKYKLADSFYLAEAVRDKIPNLVVTIYQPASYLGSKLESGYTKEFQSDVVSIYKRR